MEKMTLHITNGSSLTDRLIELGFTGEILTWHEMLCEGPTVKNIESENFLQFRKTFLSDRYNLEIDESAFKKEINKLDDHERYSEIVLWFEYDLFCHINLLGVISLITQRQIKLPLYLVCSGRVKGESDFKGLSELTARQLLQHYERKILLSNDDIELANNLWELYCGKDHNLIKLHINKKSSFKYLNSCLKAHLKRFPDSKTGLGRLEQHVLETIKLNTIKSRRHLLGYLLHYQGYYGYGDIQLMRMIDELSIFFTESKNRIILNRKGHEALLGQHNFSKEINNNISYGGVNRLDFQFNKRQNKLIKTIVNAH